VREALRRQAGREFYRPAQRPDPRPRPKQQKGDVRQQLTLTFEPLGDLFSD
jgi:hypothetical protein